jgi:hypothetical protein
MMYRQSTLKIACIKKVCDDGQNICSLLARLALSIFIMTIKRVRTGSRANKPDNISLQQDNAKPNIEHASGRQKPN